MDNSFDNNQEQNIGESLENDVQNNGPVVSDFSALDSKPSVQYPAGEVLPPAPPTIVGPTGVTNLLRRFGLVAAGVVLIASVGIWGVTRLHKPVQKNNSQEQTVSLGGVASNIAVFAGSGKSAKLIVNSQLVARGGFYLAQGEIAAQITASKLSANQIYDLPNQSGTICLDSNNCSFAKSSEFNDLQSSVASSINTTLTANVKGTANQINVAAKNGVITLSAPQDIAPSSAPSFSGLTVNGSLSVIGTVTGRKMAIKPAENDTESFTVQDANGTAVLSTDTINHQIRTAHLKPNTVGILQTGSVTHNVTISPIISTNTSAYNENNQWSVVGSDGFTRFVYADWTQNGSIHYVRCLNKSCTQNIDRMIESDPDGTDIPTIALDHSGNAYISYGVYHSPNAMRLAHCLDVDCNTKTIVTSGTAAGYSYTSGLAVGGDGFANITFDTYNNPSPDPNTLEFVHCQNTDCSSKTQTTITSNTGYTYETNTVVAGSDGLMRLAYIDGSLGRIAYVQCTNAACTTNQQSTIDNGSTAINAYYLSMAVDSNGLVGIAYPAKVGGSYYALKFVKCLTNSCATTSSKMLTQIADEHVSDADLAFSHNNEPLISYQSYTTSYNNLNYIYCQDTACSSFTKTTLDSPQYGTYYSSIVAGNDDQPQIVYLPHNDTGTLIKMINLTTLSGIDTVVQSSYTAGTDIGTSADPYGQIYARNLNLQTATSTAALVVNQQGINGQGAGPLASFQVNGVQQVGIDAKGNLQTDASLIANGNLQLNSTLTAGSASGVICDSCLPGTGVRSSTGMPYPQGLKYYGGYLIVTNDVQGPTMALYSLTDPENPALAGKTSTNDSAGKIFISGHYAYVPTYDPGNNLKIYDLNYMPSPVFVGQTGGGHNPGDIFDVKVIGTTAYVLSRNAIITYNVSDPANPTYIGILFVGSSGWGNSQLIINGNTAFIHNGSDGNTYSVNITNPAAMTLISQTAVGTSSFWFGDTIAQVGNYLYIGKNDANNPLVVLDISDPSNMVIVSNPVGSGQVGSTSTHQAIVRGSYLYLQTGIGAEIYDISNPAAPVYQSYKKYGVGNYDALFSDDGRFLYVADYNASALKVYGSNTVTSASFQTLNAQSLNAVGDATFRNNLVVMGTITDSSFTNSYLQFGSNSYGITVNTRQPGNVGLNIKSSVGQTADLQQWTEPNGSALASINSKGGLVTNGVTSTLGKLNKPTLVQGQIYAYPYDNQPTSLLANTTYYYVVTAYNSAGETLKSNEISVTTDVSAGYNYFYFSPVVGATGYKVYRSTVSGSYTTPSLVATITEFGGRPTDLVTVQDRAAPAAGAPPTSTVGSKLILQGWDAQSGNLQEWKDGTGNVIASIAVDKNVNSTGGQFIFNNLDAAAITSSYVGTIFKAKDSTNAQQINFQADGAGTYFNIMNQAGSAAGTLNFSFGYNNTLARFTSAGVLQVNSTGTAGTVEKLRVNTPTTVDNTANVILATSATTSKGLVVQGIASQAANLQEWQSSTGAILASIDASGNLSVKAATVTGNLTVNGHTITGNTSGSTTIAAGAAAGASPTVSISGNDAAGTVSITTGASGVGTGTLATVTFSAAYGVAPRVNLTAGNAATAGLQIYRGTGTTTFTINTGNAPATGTAYIFDYQIVQ